MAVPGSSGEAVGAPGSSGEAVGVPGSSGEAVGVLGSCREIRDRAHPATRMGVIKSIISSIRVRQPALMKQCREIRDRAHPATDLNPARSKPAPPTFHCAPRPPPPRPSGTPRGGPTRRTPLGNPLLLFWRPAAAAPPAAPPPCWASLDEPSPPDFSHPPLQSFKRLTPSERDSPPPSHPTGSPSPLPRRPSPARWAAHSDGTVTRTPASVSRWQGPRPPSRPRQSERLLRRLWPGYSMLPLQPGPTRTGAGILLVERDAG